MPTDVLIAGVLSRRARFVAPHELWANGGPLIAPPPAPGTHRTKQRHAH